MFLIRDKYKPKSFNDFLIKRDLLLYKKLYQYDVSNTIIYGASGSGKYTFAMCVLEQLYGEEVYKKKTQIIKIDSKSGIKEISVICSKYHYEIYLNDYILNNKTSLINVVKEICTTRNVITNQHKIIVIKNGDFILDDNIKIFKNLAETYFDTCHFIITFNQLSKITQEFRGIFTFVRIPCAKNNEMKDLLKYISFKENINTKDDDLNKIIKKSQRNLNKLFLIYELSYQTKEYEDINDPIETSIYKLTKLIDQKKAEKIIDIRKTLYDLMSKNIVKKSIYKTVLKYYTNKKELENDKKFKIIESCAKYQHRSNKCYREIIHLEAWLVDIMRILIE